MKFDLTGCTRLGKRLATSLGLLGVLLGIVPPGHAQVTSFSDIRGHWSQLCVEKLADLNIVSAYQDALFRPDQPLTRGLYADMLRRAFPNIPKVQASPVFLDVTPGTRFQQSIDIAYQQGFFTGVSSQLFRPEAAISRQDLLVALSRGLNLTATSNISEILNSTFNDAQAVAGYAQAAVAAATEQNFVVNYPDVRLLQPQVAATRAEGAAIICQARLGALADTGVSADYIAEMPTIPGLVIESQVDSTGTVLAELSYFKENYVYDSLRIRVTRRNQLILDQSIPREGGFTRALGLRVIDLDGDQEPEILIDFLAGQERCCSFSLVYSYLPRRQEYGLTEQRWDYADYLLVDLNQDGIPEFKSADTRFSFRFDEQALAMTLPLQIWHYRQGQFFDATGFYPDFVESSAAELWQQYERIGGQSPNSKGVLAAYAATKFVLGEGEAGFRQVEYQYVGADRSRYLRELREFLRGTGYTNY